MQNFYEQYLKLAKEITEGLSDDAELFKKEYLKQRLKDNKVYKFISLDGDEKDIKAKLDTFKQSKVWFSNYAYLNDKSECDVLYDAQCISQATGLNKKYISMVMDTVMQTLDILSLTYEYQEYMWKTYASNGNGICIEYDVINYKDMFPVAYIDKLGIDYNKMVINAIKYGKVKELSIIPWVIKNPYNVTSDLDSTMEKEVRVLYSPFDEDELNDGRVYPTVKDDLGYKGIAVPCEKVGLKISKVVIGDKCDNHIVQAFTGHINKERIEYLISEKE